MAKSDPSNGESRQANRREFLKGTSGLAVGLVVGVPAVVAPGKAKASTVIRYADDGGRTGDGRQEHYIKPFMEATGIEVQTYVGQKNLAKMRAMVATNNLEFDMLNIGGSHLSSASKAGLLEDLDKSKLELSDFLFDKWIWKDRIAWEYFSGGLGYNEDSVEEPPRTWAGYFDLEKFPGRRGFRTRPQYTLEEALQADGVDPKDLYPLDVDRAFRVLDRIKDDVSIWISETAKTIEHLQTREVDYASTFSGRVFIARNEGLPINFVFDMPNSAPQGVAIMKGAKNYDACMQLVQWFIDGESAFGWFDSFIGYGPTTSKVMNRLSDETISRLPDPANPKANWVDVDWWGDNLESVTKRYKEWLLT